MRLLRRQNVRGTEGARVYYEPRLSDFDSLLSAAGVPYFHKIFTANELKE